MRGKRTMMQEKMRRKEKIKEKIKYKGEKREMKVDEKERE
jgi:hypothetical protein